MTDAGRGVLAMVAACTIWGLSPLYYKLLTHVPPLEVLSHRALWSLAFFGLVLVLQRRLVEIPKLLSRPSRLGLVALASVMISTNWGLYIWSVQSDRVTEASLGYYIFPLVAVLFGAAIFGERLGAVRWAAVALAAGAVAVLWAGLGDLPWISLVLALTFGVYGVLKKKSEAGPVVSVTAEVLLLAPLAIGYLVFLLPVHEALDPVSLGLLALSGPLTAGPLILMSYASRRVGLSTLGIIQYLNPTLQFLCAVAIFAEPITAWHMVAFPLIWAALAIYSTESLRQERSARRRDRQASTVSGASR
jgi:chloramphenicol-sensitive protein RarD